MYKVFVTIGLTVKFLDKIKKKVCIVNLTELLLVLSG